MKITLSKSQWTIIGKKTGWLKSNNTKISSENITIGELQYDHTKEFSLTYNLNNQKYTIEGSFQYDFYPEQKGGTTDPSWTAHFTYLGYKIDNIKGFKTPEEQSQILQSINTILNKYGEDNTPDVKQLQLDQ